MADNKHTHLKNWPAAERPRERLLQQGASTLSDAQLLGIILRTGTGGRTAVDVGRDLLERFGGLSGIAQAGIKELTGVPGIGDAKAAEIKAAIELGRRHQKPTMAGASFCASQEVADFYQPRLRDARKEEFRCILLDTKNRLIREETVSTGSLTASLVHPRETFKSAVRESAAAVIFVHNHPSGDIKPSQEDILLTRRLVQAGDLLGIRVLDHVIVGDGGHFSFRDSGLLAAPA
ncbi:MAG: RadC family protein [Nitrospirota bacterium]